MGTDRFTGRSEGMYWDDGMHPDDRVYDIDPEDNFDEDAAVEQAERMYEKWLDR